VASLSSDNNWYKTKRDSKAMPSSGDRAMLRAIINRHPKFATTGWLPVP